MEIARPEKNGKESKTVIMLLEVSEARVLHEALTAYCAVNKRLVKAKNLLKELDDGLFIYGG